MVTVVVFGSTRKKLEIEKMDTMVLIEQGMMVLMSGMSGILIFCVREGITIQKI